jgi:putative addiction module component (TIGR02574 family)
MAIDLSSDQLNALSVPEKVRLLEQVWQSLCDQPAEIPSPEWHAEELRKRARRLADGEAVRVPWSEAKAHLQRLAE